MKKISQITTISLSLLCYIPSSIFAIPTTKIQIEGMAHNLLSKAEMGDVNGMIDSLNEFQASLQNSKKVIEEAEQFLQSFISEINKRYVLSLTIKDACQFVRLNSDKLQIPAEIMPTFLQLMDLLETRETELSNQRQSKLCERECHWGSSKKKNTKKLPTASIQPEFTLPDNMSVGFVCMLAGGLLCILPFGVTQLAGAELIVMGFGFVGNGLVQGEKPYYVNPETGQVLQPHP